MKHGLVENNSSKATFLKTELRANTFGGRGGCECDPGLGQRNPAKMQFNMCLGFVFAGKTRIKIDVFIEISIFIRVFPANTKPRHIFACISAGLVWPMPLSSLPPPQVFALSSFSQKVALEENFSTSPLFIHTFSFVLGQVVFQTQGCDWQCSFLEPP